MSTCCGSDETEGTSRRCPCTSLVRRHPVAVYVGLTIVAAMLLSIPVGALLGIVAFIRTL
jgi:hypothetical protein